MRVALAIVMAGLLVTGGVSARAQQSTAQQKQGAAIHSTAAAASKPSGVSLGDRTEVAAATSTRCDDIASPACAPTKADLKKARKEFERGQKLQKNDPEGALEALTTAAKLAPRNVAYAHAREVLRQQLVFRYVQRGNLYASAQRTVDAVAEFRKALELDSTNEYAAQQLRNVTGAPIPPAPTWLPESEENELTLHPQAGRQSFHFASDTRNAYNNIARAFGIKATPDESVPLKQLRIDIDNATFHQAMNAVAAMSRTFWTPISSAEVLIAAETPAKHKELDRMMLRTFYLPEATNAQELNDIVNLLRTVFEIRFVTLSPAQKTLTVRAPAPLMQAATTFLQSLAAGRPQVMLDVELYEVNRQMLQSIGVQLPLQYKIFNIPAAALAGLGNQNIQQLINQLIAQGGINQANFSSLQALLGQLQNQQNSLFSQPVATFGGGTTLMGIQVPPATANFSRSESRVYTLEKVSMRAAHGDAATLHFGERYPIINASFAPVFNTPQIANILGNNSFVAPFPSFTYEDLGVTLKAKPFVHGTADVTLDLELELKTLAGQSFNGVPVIGNRSYKGTITVANHETAVMAGSLSLSDQRTLAGAPGFAHLPVLGAAFSNRNNEHDEAELLIVITPHIVRAGATGAAMTIAIPRQ